MIIKRSSKNDSLMKTKNRPNTQGTQRGFSAPSPHDFRTFSAGSPLYCSGKGVEKVRRSCGKRGEYLLMVY